MFVVSWIELVQDFTSACGHYEVRKRKFHFFANAFELFMELQTQENVEMIELKVQK